jgi:hypothetical protein
MIERAISSVIVQRRCIAHVAGDGGSGRTAARWVAIVVLLGVRVA